MNPFPRNIAGPHSSWPECWLFLTLLAASSAAFAQRLGRRLQFRVSRAQHRLRHRKRRSRGTNRSSAGGASRELPPSTLTMPLNTTVTPPATSSGPPNTTVVPPNTTAMPPSTSAGPPNTTVIPPNTTAMPPPTSSGHPTRQYSSEYDGDATAFELQVHQALSAAPSTSTGPGEHDSAVDEPGNETAWTAAQSELRTECSRAL